MAVEPPPVTMASSSTASRTTLSASSSERSISSTTCLVPPRMRMETARGFSQPVTKVISSLSILRTSIDAAPPRSPSPRSAGLVTMPAFVALDSFSRSEALTRCSARIPSWARKCWASSSMPFWQKTAVAPAFFSCLTIERSAFSSPRTKAWS